MKTEWIEQIKTRAEERYENGGWDVIVECYSDSEIQRDFIDGAEDWPTVLARVQSAVSIWAERQADARNSAF